MYEVILLASTVIRILNSTLIIEIVLNRSMLEESSSFGTKLPFTFFQLNGMIPVFKILWKSLGF